jgi:hypothetical protein
MARRRCARRWLRSLALAASLALIALAALAASAPAATPPRALLVFVSTGDAPPTNRAADEQAIALLRAFERRPQLATGLMSATQGNYSDDQALLDISAGVRVSPTAYGPNLPGDLALVPGGRGGVISGWASAVQRAADAPATIHPGLMASSIPGGAAYVGATGERTVDAVAAANRAGRVADVSIGPGRTLVARTRQQLGRHRLVVATLPSGDADADLDALLAARAPDDLVLAVQEPPNGRVLQFLPIAMAARGTAGRGLRSNTTHRPGVVTGIDIMPTVLHQLGVHVPGEVTGSRIRTGKRVSAGDLESLRERYAHVAPRRIRALQVMLAGWVLLLAACALAGRARTGLRIGALAFLWLPAVVLVPGLVDPSSAMSEAVLIAVPAFILGALTDRFVAWPRAPLVPAAVTLAVYLADLATGSNLITLSLLGPNPRAGARFYGIGNELEPALPILLFVGLAALFTGRERSRHAAATFAVSGLALALAIGSGLLGADVGGVITGSVGAAVAALFMLPGRVRPRVAVGIFLVVPIVAVGALALLDLATGAQSHFSRNVLQSHGGVSLTQTIQRRYEFAYHALVRGKMPFVFALSVIAVIVALVYRDRLYSRLPGPSWRAALAGGLAGGVAGAVTNDSGPLLFVVATFVLGVVTAYVVGAPPEDQQARVLHSEKASAGAADGPSPHPAQLAS